MAFISLKDYITESQKPFIIKNYDSLNEAATMFFKDNIRKLFNTHKANFTRLFGDSLNYDGEYEFNNIKGVRGFGQKFICSGGAFRFSWDKRDFTFFKTIMNKDKTKIYVDYIDVWIGNDSDIPTITIEIPRALNIEPVFEDILKLIKKHKTGKFDVVEDENGKFNIVTPSEAKAIEQKSENMGEGIGDVLKDIRDAAVAGAKAVGAGAKAVGGALVKGIKNVASILIPGAKEITPKDNTSNGIKINVRKGVNETAKKILDNPNRFENQGKNQSSDSNQTNNQVVQNNTSVIASQ